MIDLHSHTDHSDGTFTPAELLAEADRIKLTALGITDHDTLGGYDAAVALGAPAGLTLLCGVELSTKFHGASLHLLGYFPNSAPAADFRNWLLELIETRRDRNRRLIDRLQSLGVDITLAEAEARGRSLTGRPHIARILVEKGYAKSIQGAFDEYLDESAKAYVYRDEVPTEQAIAKVVSAGGVACMAHPIRVAKNNWDTLNTWVGELAAHGMKAIEVYHSDHSPENVAYYKQLAARYGLVMSGGSDFHGGNKPNIQLGTGLHGNLHIGDKILENLRTAAR